ncbi:phage tail assembly chaperone [Novosphingobium sp. NPDC080210]|uniref:phage tail assembly chaperone n=1 Tax=Novosphingobium sp. NPDC080210 TaxID=3390596 RepID=UPI003D0233B2
MPDCLAIHLVEWWLEIGPTQAGGMGEVGLSWQEIAAWQAMVGVDLEPWEARAIRAMSVAFVSERHQAKAPDRPAPYNTETVAVVRDRVTSQFAAMIAARNTQNLD